jgi:hypothetical protein
MVSVRHSEEVVGFGSTNFSLKLEFMFLYFVYASACLDYSHIDDIYIYIYIHTYIYIYIHTCMNRHKCIQACVCYICAYAKKKVVTVTVTNAQSKKMEQAPHLMYENFFIQETQTLPPP